MGTVDSVLLLSDYHVMTQDSYLSASASHPAILEDRLVDGELAINEHLVEVRVLLLQEVCMENSAQSIVV